MDKLKEFYNSFGFIITFMFLSVLISALFGEKFLNKFLLLILTSQLLLNSDKAVSLINKLSNNNNKITGDVKNGTINSHTSSSGRIHSGGGGNF